MIDKKYDLTEGPIFNKLVKLSMPIMATSLMQTAHNLTNMFWLGRIDGGGSYVAAAGLAGQFLWLSMAFIFLCRIGVEIGVSQNMGKGDIDTAKSYSQNGFILSVAMSLVYASTVFIFRHQLIGFFSLDDAEVAHAAGQYLGLVAFALPFMFTHFLLTGVYGGCGNTKIPFYINAASILLNIILNPILIFGFGLGLYGAGLSIVTAAIFNLSVKIWAMTMYKGRPFKSYTIFTKISWDKILQILKWGVPVGMESFFFTGLFLVVSRLVAQFGVAAVAGQNIGIQVESSAFMIGGGFASALTAFIGQNYGAKKWGRIRATQRIATIFMASYGFFIAVVLFVFAEQLISLFLVDPEAIAIGGSYLRIIALTQVLFCMEGVAVGSFRGRGLTTKPTIVSISSNILRVIVTYALAATALGINGVWVGIAIAMTTKSIWLLVWLRLNMRKMPKTDGYVEKAVNI